MMWKDIEGYGGLYQINKLGQVRSHQRAVPKIMSMHKSRYGGFEYQLRVDNRTVRHEVIALYNKYFPKEDEDGGTNPI